MKYKLVSILLVAIGILNGSSLAQENIPTNYIDVYPEDWYYESIMDLSNKKVIKGYDDNSFKPNSSISREEAVQIIYDVLEENQSSKTMKKSYFEDIENNRWSSEAINFAYEVEIIEGKAENLFCPEDKLTREEAVVIINRAFRYKEVIMPEIGRELNRYRDKSEISDWALDSVERLTDYYVDGYEEDDGYFTFRPKNSITRAEFIKIISKSYNSLNR